MAHISVGLRNNGTIDVDMAPVDEDGDEGEWTFNNLDLDEAEFLLDELSQAIQRAREKGLPRMEIV